MNYKLIRNVLIFAAVLLFILWCFFNHLIDITNELYDKHHELHIVDKGEYGWLVPNYPTEDWEEVKPQWQKQCNIISVISIVGMCGTILVISTSGIVILHYIFNKFFKEAEY